MHQPIAFLSMALLPTIALAADLQVGALPEGGQVVGDVSSSPDDPATMLFGGGYLDLPTAGLLTAEAGSVDLQCQVPDVWPPERDTPLLHLGAETHVHLTLFFRKGGLIAVYKGGEPYYASLQQPASRSWKPGSWHHVEFTWQVVEPPTVRLFLRVDDELVGGANGHLIARWPERLLLGARPGAMPWPGAMRAVRLSAKPTVVPELKPGSRTLRIDAAKTVGEAYPFWTIGNFTSQQMFADPRQFDRIRADRPSIRDVNCVRLLGGRDDGLNEWFLGYDDQGHGKYDFAGLLTYLQGILDCGYTPRLVLDNVPLAMSTATELHTYGVTAPPRNPQDWHDYITAMVTALIDHFGSQTVAGWRFRVGTEPDLDPGHWSGTKQQYLDHYDNTVDAVCGLIPDADIGPGNVLNPNGGKWGLDIIDHCAATGTRMTFFSYSWYGSVGDSLDAFATAAEAARDRLDKYPQYRDLPLEIAEFAILHDEYHHRLWTGDATPWGASWYAAVADETYRLGLRQVHQWAESTAGLMHPRGHVNTMLGWMAGGQRLAVDKEAESAARCGALAVRKDDALWLLCYNHRPLREPQVPEQVTLEIADPRLHKGAVWLVDEWRIDAEHGTWIEQFYADAAAAELKVLPDAPLLGGQVARRFGKPGSELLGRNRDQYEALAALPQTATAAAIDVPEDGQLTMDFEMPGHSVRLLRFRPSKAL